MQTNNINDEKFKKQDMQYQFPYHYIPYLTTQGSVVLYRYLFWGYDYYCHLLHIKNILEQSSAHSLLDIGCGDGVFVNMMKNQISRVKGVDLSPNAIRFAKAFDNGGDHFECIDAANLTETFDVVTSIEVLEHIPDEYVSNFFRTLYDRVNPDGIVILGFPSIHLPMQKRHFRHYDISLFQKQLQESGVSLDIVSYDYIIRENKLFDLYMRFTANRLWFFDLECLSRKMWQYYWNKSKRADEKTGRHIVVTLKRKK